MATEQDWQPIDTAPRNGSVVNLNGQHPAYPMDGWWDEHQSEWAAAKMAYKLAPDVRIPEPTHWRPAPPER